MLLGNSVIAPAILVINSGGRIETRDARLQIIVYLSGSTVPVLVIDCYAVQAARHRQGRCPSSGRIVSVLVHHHRDSRSERNIRDDPRLLVAVDPYYGVPASLAEHSHIGTHHARFFGLSRE